MKVSFRSVLLNFGAIFFLNRSFVLRSRNLETGQIVIIEQGEQPKGLSTPSMGQLII
jgi:hypothetical protein